MATITSTNFQVRGGSGTIKLTETSLPSTSVEVSSIGSISAEMDLEDDSEKASSIFLKLGEFTFTMFDRLGNGSSLFNTLNGISSTTRITVEFSFTTNAGRSWTENFYFKPSDVEYNRDKREVTIESRQEGLFTQTVANIFTNNASDVYQIAFYGSGAGTEDCMPASEFINNVLPLFNSSNTSFNNSSLFYTIGQSVDGEKSYVILDRSTGPAKDLLFRMAAAEGAVVGSFMGYNFYASRLTTTNSVTFTSDDIKEESLNINIGLNSYLTVREVFELGVGGYYSYAHLTGNADGLNDEAKKRLDVYFISGVVEYATWDATNTRYQGFSSSPTESTSTGVYVAGDQKQGTTTITIDNGSGGSAPGDVLDGDLIWFENTGDFGLEVSPFYIANGNNTATTLEVETSLVDDISDGMQVFKLNDVGVNDIATKGTDSYAAAYSATGKQIIQFTAFGIDSIKPYQSITFDSSLPSGIAGSTYRPSELEYDFENDVIKVGAYKIA